MAKPRPEKNSPERRVLPMNPHVGDRLTDETGEYEVIGRPYTTNIGKRAHVRVKRVDNAEVTMIRTYAAHERRITRGNSYSVILRRISRGLSCDVQKKPRSQWDRHEARRLLSPRDDSSKSARQSAARR